MLLAVAFFVFFGAVLLSSWSTGLLAGAIVVTYCTQLYYLNQVKRSEAARRLHIWEASLFSHLIVYGGAAWMLRDPGLAAAVLAAETVSAMCHAVAIVHLRRARIAD
jgi:hypothetical protein